MDFFATAAKGTEGALRDELKEIGLSEIRADKGGVHFRGTLEDGYRACLWSRIAMRVLAWRAGFDARGERPLYDGVRSIDWGHFLEPGRTLAVKATCKSSTLTHSQYVAQLTKDAIVDQLRERFGHRPSVDLKDPDVRVSVHLVKDHADVYLDLAGDALHLRGYRARIGAAPLKETLAAAVLRLAKWDRRTPLLDPMCGAGTIAIEAAGWSRHIAPGLSRARFGFERWVCFDAASRARWEELKRAARQRARASGAEVTASDDDRAALDLTRENARVAGVELALEQRDVRELTGEGPRFIVTNPPYGERLEADAAFYPQMAASLRKLRGHTVAILAGTPAVERAMGKPDRWQILFNGPLECRLLVYGL